MFNNQKGFIFAAIPITLAILGLVGTGAFAGVDRHKNTVHQRDAQRATDIQVIGAKLSEYKTANSKYPLQKNQSTSGMEVLEAVLGAIPNDPLSSKGWTYSYWSDETVYTLRYMSEATHFEVVIFGE